MLDTLLAGVCQGLIWAVLALGMYISFRILNFADLTCEGCITLGASISAMLIWKELNPFLSVLVAFLAGSIAGTVTGLLNTKLKIPPILSGILTMISLYSINIHIMSLATGTGGTANLSLLTFRSNTAYARVSSLLGLGKVYSSLIFGVVVVLAVSGILYWFFGTELGCAIRATGANTTMCRAQGINTDLTKLCGLALSNGLIAASGALLCQYQNYADVNMGVGSIIIGLASIIIGETLFMKFKNFYMKLTGVIAGAVIYRVVVAFVIYSGMPSTDLKIMTAGIVTVALALPTIRKFIGSSRLFKKVRRREKMAETMLELRSVSKTFNPGTVNEKKAIDRVSLNVRRGDFITIIGGNGAGKSTLINAITGVFQIDEGEIILDGADIIGLSEHKRAKHFGRVFQDPMLGTAPNMTIEENMALAYRRGKRHSLRWGISPRERAFYREQLKQLELGLEDRMIQKVGLLSGGQRQALTLLMATLIRPKMLLLDEHTAALDPKTAKKVLKITEELVRKDNLTTLMVTHNMKNAIEYGNRLIMMNDGRIILDIDGEEKKKLTVEMLLEKFSKVSGSEFTSDRALLS